MSKINFKNPDVRIKSDIICLIVLTLFALGMCLYNMVLPDNTIISCDKSIDECKVTYTGILSDFCIQKDIIFKISDIKDIEFNPAHRMGARSYKLANISLSVKYDTNRGLYINNEVIQPSINEDDTKFLANRINNYLSNTENSFYFNRNNEINPSTRKGFVTGILLYYLIAFIMILSDILYYKNKQ